MLLPHDCRRVFASEHLNNNTPVHIIQALLGHASPDTVMIYAKLYPSQLIEEYRKTVRSLYNAYYGEDGLKNPTAEEWAAFRDELQPTRYGHTPLRLAHWRALPEGIDLPWLCTCAAEEKCGADLSAHARKPRAQPAEGARSQQPAGQIASREMEIVRIKGALQRAEQLTDDVAAAIERAL